MIAMPIDFACPMNRNRFSVSTSFSALVGSSMISTLTSFAMTFAISINCFCATVQRPIGIFGSMSTPIFAMISRAPRYMRR